MYLGEEVLKHVVGLYYPYFGYKIVVLKLIAIENGMNVPDLHMEPTYSKALHFNLSTSQVRNKAGLKISYL